MLQNAGIICLNNFSGYGGFGPIPFSGGYSGGGGYNGYNGFGPVPYAGGYGYGNGFGYGPF